MALIILQIGSIGVQFSNGLSFEARNLTDSEKSIAERDYLSIIQKCNDKLKSKTDTGEICDAFMGYFISQCEALDDLLSFCDIQSTDDLVVGINPLLNYDIDRRYQEGCLKQDKFITELIICEDYLNIPGAAAERFKQTVTTKPHVIIPSSKIYTDSLSSKIFGEVLNNFTYPIEFVRIFAQVNDSNGKTIDIKHTNTYGSYLKPGQRAGFWLLFENPIPEQSNYTLTSEFKKSERILPEKLQLQVNNFVIPSLITGNITNLGNVTATNVEISAIFYDWNHIVVDTNSDYVNIEEGILPGEQANFDLTPIINSQNSDRITSYALNVQSSEYSMVPSPQ